ncbi:MAG TPA: ABC transporter permease [Syntrophomonas sp.]|jgi:putative ABC transport system permease protein|nr:ABC transporter permease [Syntrophomonas sp.]HCF71353.1 ABC transporter permease [Syntrophomonas sp.]
MFKIIRHSLTKRWIQSVATLFTVAISVGILFALYLLYHGITMGLSTSENRMGADLLVIPDDARDLQDSSELLFTGAPVCIYMNKNYEKEVAHISGVEKVSAQFFTQTLNASCCSTATATRLIGFDPATDWAVQSWLKKLPAKSLAYNEVLAGRNVSGFIGSNTYILGKKVHVAANFEPTGTSLDHSIIMNIDLARKMAQGKPELQHFWQRYGDPDQIISALLVKVEAGKKDEVANAITDLGDLAVIKSSDILQGIKDQLDTVFYIMLGAGLLAALASIFQLFARFYSLAWDRKGELGLYRAMGATRRDLKILVIGEALCLTSGGIILGSILGSIFYYLILLLLESQKAFPFIPAAWPAVLFGIIGITTLFELIGFISAWFPARQSGKIEPSAAMALGDID